MTSLTLYLTESGEVQWEAGVVGQTAHQASGERQQSPYLLPDGQDVGHPGRVPGYETLHIPGKIDSFQRLSLVQ